MEDQKIFLVPTNTKIIWPGPELENLKCKVCTYIFYSAHFEVFNDFIYDWRDLYKEEFQSKKHSAQQKMTHQQVSNMGQNLHVPNTIHPNFLHPSKNMFKNRPTIPINLHLSSQNMLLSNQQHSFHHGFQYFQAQQLLQLQKCIKQDKICI